MRCCQSLLGLFADRIDSIILCCPHRVLFVWRLSRQLVCPPLEPLLLPTSAIRLVVFARRPLFNAAFFVRRCGVWTPQLVVEEGCRRAASTLRATRRAHASSCRHSCERRPPLGSSFLRCARSSKQHFCRRCGATTAAPPGGCRETGPPAIRPSRTTTAGPYLAWPLAAVLPS